MRRKLPFVLGAFLAVAVFLAFLSMAIIEVSFDRQFYAAQYTALGVPEDLRVDLPTLMSYTEVLLDYLRGEVPSPNVVATVRGRNGLLYGEREVKHLRDVRYLFALTFLVRNISIVALLLLLTALLWTRNFNRGVRGYFCGSAVISCLLLILGLLAAVDFTHYFTLFHLLTFDNDLWLLNPATEYLIRMVPEPFFMAAALRIVLLTVGKFALAGVAALVGVSLYAHAVKRNG
ncbi:MAG: TIGR01906 family membrane protein [Firmicutes bacterium]|nr:TIGR01906 family membrane protein [Dethiobacter sp.]MBS3889582.1 TIGR01906 family membrane protein [Bacillota bacterium]